MKDQLDPFRVWSAIEILYRWKNVPIKYETAEEATPTYKQHRVVVAGKAELYDKYLGNEAVEKNENSFITDEDLADILYVTVEEARVWLKVFENSGLLKNCREGAETVDEKYYRITDKDTHEVMMWLQWADERIDQVLPSRDNPDGEEESENCTHWFNWGELDISHQGEYVRRYGTCEKFGCEVVDTWRNRQREFISEGDSS